LEVDVEITFELAGASQRQPREANGNLVETQPHRALQRTALTQRERQTPLQPAALALDGALAAEQAVGVIQIAGGDGREAQPVPAERRLLVDLGRAQRGRLLVIVELKSEGRAFDAGQG